MYKLSVILPVYGVREFLPAALETLKQQTIGFENLQIIFADDCSKDGSWEVVQQYAQEYPNVECVRLEANSGGCGAPRNKGMELAVAPYIVYMDPDDLLPPSAYQDLYTAILNTDAEIVTGWYDIQTQNGKILAEKCSETFALPENRDFCMPQDLEASFATLPMVWCKIYRRDFLLANKMAFMSKIPGEDQVYTVQAYLKASKVYYLNKCVYHYIRRDTENESLSTNLNAQYFSGIRKCIDAVSAAFQEAEQMQAGELFIGGLIESQIHLLCTTKQLSQAEWEKEYDAILPYIKQNGTGMISKLFLLCISSEQAYHFAQVLREILVHQKNVQEYANALCCERDRILQELEIYKDWVNNLLQKDKQTTQQLTESDKRSEELSAALADVQQELLEIRNSRTMRYTKKIKRLLHFPGGD